MVRVLLLIAVIAIGYDAVEHQGAYTRDAWHKVVGITEQLVGKAQQMGEATREETRSQLN